MDVVIVWKCALIHDPAAVQGVRDLANVRAIVNNNKGPSGVLWGLVGSCGVSLKMPHKVLYGPTSTRKYSTGKVTSGGTINK